MVLLTCQILGAIHMDRHRGLPLPVSPLLFRVFREGLIQERLHVGRVRTPGQGPAKRVHGVVILRRFQLPAAQGHIAGNDGRLGSGRTPGGIQPHSDSGGLRTLPGFQRFGHGEGLEGVTTTPFRQVLFPIQEEAQDEVLPTAFPFSFFLAGGGGRFSIRRIRFSRTTSRSPPSIRWSGGIMWNGT